MAQQFQDRIDELEFLVAKYEQVIAECVCFPSAQVPEGRARMLANNIDLARDRYRTARYFAQLAVNEAE